MYSCIFQEVVKEALVDVGCGLDSRNAIETFNERYNRDVDFSIKLVERIDKKVVTTEDKGFRKLEESIQKLSRATAEKTSKNIVTTTWLSLHEVGIDATFIQRDTSAIGNAIIRFYEAKNGDAAF